MKRLLILLLLGATVFLTACVPQLSTRIEDACRGHGGERSVQAAGRSLNESNFKEVTAIPHSEDDRQNLHFRIVCADGSSSVRTAK